MAGIRLDVLLVALTVVGGYGLAIEKDQSLQTVLRRFSEYGPSGDPIDTGRLTLDLKPFKRVNIEQMSITVEGEARDKELPAIKLTEAKEDKLVSEPSAEEEITERLATGVSCNSTHSCPTGYKCCIGSSGEWRCCPPNYSCIHFTNWCRKNDRKSKLVENHPAMNEVKKENHELVSKTSSEEENSERLATGVSCNSTHSCPTGYKCCIGSSGEWRCCPPNYSCIHFTNWCRKNDRKSKPVENHPATNEVKNENQELVSKTSSEEENSERLASGVSCNSTHSCPTGYKCCIGSSGEWRCCPPNYSCIHFTNWCRKNDRKSKLVENHPAMNEVKKENHELVSKTSSEEENSERLATGVSCNSTHSCPTGYKCCIGSSGEWRCCPPNYSCIHFTNWCRKNDRKSKPVENHPATNEVKKENQELVSKTSSEEENSERLATGVSCNSTHSCPTGYKCCIGSSGEWRCCPPTYSCIHFTNWCRKNDRKSKLVENHPAMNEVKKENQELVSKTSSEEEHSERLATGVSCNSTHSCPTGYKCCIGSSGEWRCCPPNYSCIHFTNWCRKNDRKSKPVENHPATNEVKNENQELVSKTSSEEENSERLATGVSCNSTHSCPTGYKCCIGSSGEWRCCPPNYSCIHFTNWCRKNDRKSKLVENHPAMNEVKKENQELVSKTSSEEENSERLATGVSCNSTHSCPTGYKCCIGSSGEWRCCPPNYSCIHFTNWCRKNDRKSKPVENHPATNEVKNENQELVSKTSLEEENSERLATGVSCNSTHSCPTGYKCCIGSSGEWRCCPPNYSCIHFTNWCRKNDRKSKLVENHPAMNEVKKENQELVSKTSSEEENSERLATGVSCNSTHSCPTGYKCCIGSSGEWRCCPPNYSCIHFTNWCRKNDRTSKPVENHPATNEVKKENQELVSKTSSEEENSKRLATGVSCNSTHSCPTGYKCCIGSSGEWRCCPPNYSCIHFTNWCRKNDRKSKLVENHPATNEVKKENKELVSKPSAEEEHRERLATGVSCNSTHSCPTGYKCCIGSSGEWRCCPPNYSCIHFTNWCRKNDRNSKPVENHPATNEVKKENHELVSKTSSEEENSERLATGVSCNSTHSCPTGYKCCIGSSGEWRCCPPTHSCIHFTNWCHKKHRKSKLVENHPARNGVKKENQELVAKPFAEEEITEKLATGVSCNSTHSCPTGYKCCIGSSGEWRCCPPTYSCIHFTNWCRKNDRKSKPVENHPATSNPELVREGSSKRDKGD